MTTMMPPAQEPWDTATMTDTDMSNNYYQHQQYQHQQYQHQQYQHQQYQHPQYQQYQYQQYPQPEPTIVAWEKDPGNPHNWPKWKKMIQIVSFSLACFTTSVGVSLPSSAAVQFQEEFDVTVTQSILPVSLYVFALGLGPVVAGPLSEAIGRRPIYIGSMILGALFTMGAALVHNFGGLCFLRFMAGFCFSPSLVVIAGSVTDTWSIVDRPIPMIIAILMPFMGPGFGPIIGAFLVSRKDWRWTQWVLMMFAGVTLVFALLAEETYHVTLQRKRAKRLGLPFEGKPSIKKLAGEFLTVGLLRPLHMLVSEPIVLLTSLYIACEFATLFAFFAGAPYVFLTVYGFTIEQAGLVFIGMIIGCLLGALTIMLCTALLVLPRAKNYPAGRAPPELRLFSGIIGSVLPPIGLFMFAWSAREDVSWGVPAAAIIPFSWGNFCIFVSCMHYLSETYGHTVVASVASANSLLRYTFAGLLLLFTVEMYEGMTIEWAVSLLGFVAIALGPIPWFFYRWGPRIRAKSKYELAY